MNRNLIIFLILSILSVLRGIRIISNDKTPILILAADSDSSSGGIQFMITRRMRKQLEDELGYLSNEIDQMDPQIAAVVIDKKLPRPMTGMPNSWKRSNSDKSNGNNIDLFKPVKSLISSMMKVLSSTIKVSTRYIPYLIGVATIYYGIPIVASKLPSLEDFSLPTLKLPSFGSSDDDDDDYDRSSSSSNNNRMMKSKYTSDYYNLPSTSSYSSSSKNNSDNNKVKKSAKASRESYSDPSFSSMKKGMNNKNQIKPTTSTKKTSSSSSSSSLSRGDIYSESQMNNNNYNMFSDNNDMYKPILTPSSSSNNNSNNKKKENMKPKINTMNMNKASTLSVGDRVSLFRDSFFGK